MRRRLAGAGKAIQDEDFRGKAVVRAPETGHFRRKGELGVRTLFKSLQNSLKLVQSGLKNFGRPLVPRNSKMGLFRSFWEGEELLSRGRLILDARKERAVRSKTLRRRPTSGVPIFLCRALNGSNFWFLIHLAKVTYVKSPGNKVIPQASLSVGSSTKAICHGGRV